MWTTTWIGRNVEHISNVHIVSNSSTVGNIGHCSSMRPPLIGRVLAALATKRARAGELFGTTGAGRRAGH